VLLNGNWPDWSALGGILLFSLVVIGVMLVLMKRHDTTFARLVIQ